VGPGAFGLQPGGVSNGRLRWGRTECRRTIGCEAGAGRRDSPQAVPWQRLFARCTLVGGARDVVAVLSGFRPKTIFFFDRSNATEPDYIISTYPVHLICHLLTRPEGHRPRSIDQGVRFKPVETSRAHLRVITLLFPRSMFTCHVGCVRSIDPTVLVPSWIVVLCIALRAPA